ncbi:hypothetical protein TB2_009867 [Malus domestica]
MLERPRRCCEGTAMGAIILYFQYSLEIGNQTGRRELTAALVMAKGYKSFSYAVPLKEVVPGTLGKCLLKCLNHPHHTLQMLHL